MKHAISVGLVAMAFVAGCGSDSGTATGNTGTRSAVPAQVGGQAPPDNPNAPPDNPNAPPDNPNAPPDNTAAPPSGAGTPAGAPTFDCSNLCGTLGSCIPNCMPSCTGLGAVATPCVARLNALLACASQNGFSCNVRGGLQDNSCRGEAESLLNCLGIDTSIRTPQAGGQSNDGPPPGQ